MCYSRKSVRDGQYAIKHNYTTVALYDAKRDIVAISHGDTWVYISRSDLRGINNQVTQCVCSERARRRRKEKDD